SDAWAASSCPSTYGISSSSQTGCSLRLIVKPLLRTTIPAPLSIRFVPGTAATVPCSLAPPVLQQSRRRRAAHIPEASGPLDDRDPVVRARHESTSPSRDRSQISLLAEPQRVFLRAALFAVPTRVV